MNEPSNFRRVVRAARLASEGVHPYDTSYTITQEKWRQLCRVEELLSFSTANELAHDYQLARDQMQMALAELRGVLSTP